LDLGIAGVTPVGEITPQDFLKLFAAFLERKRV
jgi:hypothetical protein